MFAFKVGSDWTEYRGQLLPILGEDAQSTYRVPEAWPDEDKAERFGVIRVTLDDVPEGKQIASYTLVDADGAPRRSSTFEDIPTRVPELISDRQFFQALASPPYEIITQEEALAAVKTGEIPAAMMAIISQLPEGAQFGATMLVSGATTFRRDHSLTGIVGTAFGWSDAQIDAFFIAADAL